MSPEPPPATPPSSPRSTPSAAGRRSRDTTTGRLLAVCVGRPREIAWRGETVETAIFKAPVDGPVRVRRLGLEGDGQADRTVHGGVDKAVYAYDHSGTEHFRAALDRPALAAGAFGENLWLDLATEEDVRIGDRIAIGDVRLEVSQPRQPCPKLGLRFDDPGFPKRFIRSGRVGYYLRVLAEGTIAAGDAVELERVDPDALDVRAVVALWLDRDASPEALERAVAMEALADAWRTPLRQRLERRRPTLRP